VHLENAFCDIKTDCDQIHLRAPDVGSPLLCQIKGGGSPYHQPWYAGRSPRALMEFAKNVLISVTRC